MKCPTCGNTLRISKKDSRFALCDECRKKFRIPEKRRKAQIRHTEPAPEQDVQTAAVSGSSAEENELSTDATRIFSTQDVRRALKKQNAETAAQKASQSSAPAASSQEDDGEFHLRYANIPPKEVREKQESEMRKAYDELLSIGKEERARKKRGFFGRRK